MTVKIASIHFSPVHADRSIYGGMYDIPAVALGAEPAILVVEDKLQRDEGPYSTGPGGGRRVKLEYAVYGQEIARDIVGEWTQNGRGMTPDAHPGIWVVRDRIAVMKTEYGKEVPLIDVLGHQVFRQASYEETQRMWDEDLAMATSADRAYADWCFIDGNRVAADARMILFIPQAYKRAARQYGHQADWLKEGAAYSVAPCPHCTTIVPKSAMMCPKCTLPIDLQRYAAWEVQRTIAMTSAQNQNTGRGMGGYGKEKEKDKEKVAA